MTLRWLSIGVFFAIVIYGIFRLNITSELAALQAQTKIRTLNSLRGQIGGGEASPHIRDVIGSIDSQTREAEQTNQTALQNMAGLRIVQIVLTCFVGALTLIVFILKVMGRPVDGYTVTFTFGSFTSILGFWFYIPKG